MSRKIEVRAWNGKQMLDWAWITAMGFVRQVILNEAGAYEVMQYTGLKDRNGNKIFEGDIIRVINDDVEQLRKVFWHEEMAMFLTENINFKDDTLFGFSWLNSAYSIEVIGNIYEHPHLINQHP